MHNGYATHRLIFYRLQHECDDWDKILQERSRLSEEAARYKTISILVKQYHTNLFLHLIKSYPSPTNNQISIFSTHCRKAADVEESVQEPPTTLSAEQRALLEGAPNYDMIGDFLRKVHTEMDLFVSSLKTYCNCNCRFIVRIRSLRQSPWIQIA